MKPTLKLVLCILIAIIPLIYLAFIWDALPAIVPTHFDASGEANDYSPKRQLWLIIGGISVVTIGQYLLMNNMHRIDPKRHGAEPSRSFGRLADGLVFFLTAINFVALLASSGHQVVVTRLIPVLIGLLFAFLGNVMYSLKPNYFAGIRVPWTLADDANWRATHRVAGVLWFVGGIVLAVAALALQGKYLDNLLLILLVPMVLIPVGYSFWYFKRSFARKP